MTHRWDTGSARTSFGDRDMLQFAAAAAQLVRALPFRSRIELYRVMRAISGKHRVPHTAARRRWLRMQTLAEAIERNGLTPGASA